MSAASSALIATSVLLGALEVTAQSTPPVAAKGAPASPASVSRVDTVIACATPRRAALASAVESSLRRAGLGGSIEWSESFEPAQVARTPQSPLAPLASVWIDALDPSEISLYIADSRSDHVYVRRFPLEPGLDSVATDLLEFVLESSLRAVKSGRVLGVSRSMYAESFRRSEAAETGGGAAERGAPPPQRQDDREGGILAGYGVTAFGDRALSSGPFVGGRYGSRALAARLELWHFWPYGLPDAALTAKLTVWGVRAGLSWWPLTRGWLMGGLFAGGGVDATRIAPQARSASAEVRAPFYYFDPMLVAGPSVAVRGAHWRIEANVRGECLPRQPRYVVSTSGARASVARLWQFRPTVGVGVLVLLP